MGFAGHDTKKIYLPLRLDKNNKAITFCKEKHRFTQLR